jgi:hypothetical protein
MHAEIAIKAELDFSTHMFKQRQQSFSVLRRTNGNKRIFVEIANENHRFIASVH